MPADLFFVKKPAHFAHEFRAGVRRARFAAGAGVFCHDYAAVEVGGVFLFNHIRESGVKGGVHIRGQAAGAAEHVARLQPFHAGEIRDEIFEIGGVEAGVAIAARLLLIGEDGDRRIFRLFAGKGRHSGRVCAHTVVMAVAADHAAVKADVAHREGGHELKLRAEEIALHNAVFFMEQLHNIELHKLAALIAAEGPAADENVELLAPHAVCKRALHLLLCQMGEQVGYNEFRLIRLLADAHIDLAAVAADDHAVQREGNCRPLVFFDAAVIMGFEQGHLKILIEWVGLEIKAGRINMRRGNPHAFSHALFPDDGENNGFFPV